MHQMEKISQVMWQREKEIEDKVEQKKANEQREGKFEQQQELNDAERQM